MDVASLSFAGVKILQLTSWSSGSHHLSAPVLRCFLILSCRSCAVDKSTGPGLHMTCLALHYYQFWLSVIVFAAKRSVFDEG